MCAWVRVQQIGLQLLVCDLRSETNALKTNNCEFLKRLYSFQNGPYLIHAYAYIVFVRTSTIRYCWLMNAFHETNMNRVLLLDRQWKPNGFAGLIEIFDESRTYIMYIWFAAHIRLSVIAIVTLQYQTDELLFQLAQNVFAFYFSESVVPNDQVCYDRNNRAMFAIAMWLLRIHHHAFLLNSNPICSSSAWRFRNRAVCRSNVLRYYEIWR